MTARAMRPRSEICPVVRVITSASILGRGHGFEMIGIDAGVIAAKMIERQAAGDWPDQSDVYRSVGELDPAV